MTQDKLYKSISKKIIPVIKKLFRKTFSSQSDPYGERFKRLKSGKRYDSNHTLRNSVKFTLEDGSIVATSSLDYFKYHQTGTKYLPARPSFPIEGEADPWRKEVKTLIDAEVKVYTKDNLKLAWKGVKTVFTTSKGKRRKK